jgi:general secretion pathway protein B
MSYILDALKKAEQERDSGRVAAQIPGPRPRPYAHQPRWAWGLAVVLLVNAAVLIAVVRLDRIGVALVPAGSSGSGAKPEPAMVREPATSPVTARLTAEPVTRVDPVQGERSAAPAVRPGHDASSAPRIERPKPTGPAPRPAKPATSQTAVRGVAPAAPSTSERKATGEPVAEPDAASRPMSTEPPAALGETVANLRLEALVYSEMAPQRMVFINNRRYVEGQTIDGDVRVEKIIEEGVILSYQGRRFLLLVGQRSSPAAGAAGTER